MGTEQNQPSEAENRPLFSDRGKVTEICQAAWKGNFSVAAQIVADFRRTCIAAPVARAEAAEAERDRLATAIRTHRSQRADDRCIEDDDRLYESLGDGVKCDRRVGDKEAMLANCRRFIENRCEGGGWPTYVELEAERDRLRAALSMLAQIRHVSGSAQGAFRHNLRIVDAVLAGADVRDLATVEAITKGEWKPPTETATQKERLP